MSRPNLLGASAVIASASLILMLALLVTQGVAARAPTSPPTAARSISGPTVIAPEDPNCFAWDFANYHRRRRRRFDVALARQSLG